MTITERTDNAGMRPARHDEHRTNEDEKSWTNKEKNNPAAASRAAASCLPPPSEPDWRYVLAQSHLARPGLDRLLQLRPGRSAEVIGILLVRSRSLVERFGGLGSRWSSGLQLGSSVIVTALALGITLNGLATYLG